jgi:hypothetical protein
LSSAQITICLSIRSINAFFNANVNRSLLLRPSAFVAVALFLFAGFIFWIDIFVGVLSKPSFPFYGVIQNFGVLCS